MRPLMSLSKNLFMAQKETLPVIHSHAAGIDVGSRTHFVAIGQQPDNVRSFGCYTEDLHALSSWLKEECITTIAMESTGSYWKGLFQRLQQDGFEVLLVNGRHTRNVKGRKTDVLDCQWIQRLHSLGLLSGSFLPDEATGILRHYVRQRDYLTDQAASYIKKMQQSLRQMNIRLDIAIRDIVGKSGSAIVEAILKGERDPVMLALLADYRIKKGREEVARSLNGEWREEYIFELQLSYELYQLLQTKIRTCDTEIEKLLTARLKDKQGATITSIVRKKKNKNAPRMELQQISVQLSGVNLYEIEGVSDATVLSLLSETGFDLNKFPTAKHFCSWLALSPNNKISGGKVLSRRVTHHSSRLAQALRRAANAIGNMKKGSLNQFFRRIGFRYGRMAAVTATARKLAIIIWNMLSKKEAYRYEETVVYTERLRRLQLKNIQKKIQALQIQPAELTFVTI